MAAGGRASVPKRQQGMHEVRLAGESADGFPSHLAGVKQAEVVGQSVKRSMKSPARVVVLCLARRQIACQGCRRCHCRVQGFETLKQQGVSAAESLALLHHLTGFAGDIPAASASVPGAGRPAGGHGEATGCQHTGSRR